MLAIYSTTIESAARLSEGLQFYWNERGMYQSVALFESDKEFYEAMNDQPFECVILQCIQNPLDIIEQIRTIHPICKIAVVTNNPMKLDNELAIACQQLNVEMVIRIADFEHPLALLTKQLKIR